MFDWSLAAVVDWVFSHTMEFAYSFIAFLALAIFAGMRKQAESDVNSLGGFVAGAILFPPGHLIRRLTSVYLQSFGYATRQLERSATKYLHVPARDDVPLETDAVFVPLTLEGEAKPFDHNTLLEAGKRLRIVGDPGSGKTTILKRMLRDQCRLLARSMTAHNGRLPIIIELRNLKPPTQPEADLGYWLLNVICDEVKGFAGYHMESCVASFLVGQGLLVLFDGADEIAADQYSPMENALNAVSERLAAKSVQNVVVITMRSQFHLQVRNCYAQQYPVVLQVKAFSPSDIYALLTKWPFKANGAEHAARIYGELSDRPSLRELCYNPLVLSMYIAEDQGRLRETGGSARNIYVPDSRTDFYRDIVEELLMKRREMQIGKQDVARITVRRKRKQFFGALCYNHLLNATQAANSIPFTDALALVSRIFEFNLSDPNEKNAAAQRMLRDLSSQTGLFSEEREEEQLRFIHLSFVEYFAAVYAIDQANVGWNTILSRHQENLRTGVSSVATRLREVIPFAVNLARENEQPQYLAEVCSKLPDHQLKASCFLETKAYDTEAWREFAAGLPKTLRSLIPRLENEDDARAFYTFIAALRDAEAHGYGGSDGWGQSMNDFLRAMLLNDRTVAWRVIELMAQYDAVAALRLAELCVIPLLQENPRFLIKNTEQPAFLGQMIQKAVRDNNDREAWLVYVGMASLFVPAARAELLAKEPIASLGKEDLSSRRVWTRFFGKKENLLTQIFAWIVCVNEKDGGKFVKVPYRARRLATLVFKRRYLRGVIIGKVINDIFAHYTMRYTMHVVLLSSMVFVSVLLIAYQGDPSLLPIDIAPFVYMLMVFLIYVLLVLIFHVLVRRQNTDVTFSLPYVNPVRRSSAIVVRFIAGMAPFSSDMYSGSSMFEKYVIRKRVFDWRFSRIRSIQEGRICKSIEYFHNIIK